VTAALVAAAGGAGALARYVLDGSVQERADSVLPLGTLTVNVTGSFLLGVLVGLGLHHVVPADANRIAGTGFLGGYTTFSAFAYETNRLVEDGSRGLAFANTLGSVVAGLLAALAGLAVTGVL
jgi:fluoride exporter